MSNLSCLEYKLSFINGAVEHFIFYVFELVLREVVEDEMIFEASQDEVGVHHCLFLCDYADVLGYSVLNGVNLFLFLSGERIT